MAGDVAGAPESAGRGIAPAGGAVSGLVLLGARLYAGVTIARAGLDKLPTPDWMVDQVVSLRVFPAPGFFAFLASGVEFAAGVLLALGLFTRLSALSLAFVMGVAAFGFQKVMPVTGMHIAQHFFWLFAVFAVIGGGRYSLDRIAGAGPERQGPARIAPAPGGLGRALFPWLVAGVLVVYAVVRELAPPAAPGNASASGEIESVSVAGSFNGWDLTANPLELGDGGRWSAGIEIGEAGPVEFKFAANGSWDLNVGESDQGSAGFPVTGTGELGGDNITAYVPRAGIYRFSIDPDGLAYALEAAD